MKRQAVHALRGNPDGKPVVLDLCCGGGGVAKGLQDAGCFAVGLDNRPQPRYAGDMFIEDDAIEVLAILAEGGCYELPPGLRGGPLGRCLHLCDIDAFHLSAPCQPWSPSTLSQRRKGKIYPDLITPCRPLLQQTGKPWTMENVPQAPLRADYTLCGCMFGLEIPGVAQLLRERAIETSWGGPGLQPEHDHRLPAISICGHGTPAWQRRITGHISVAQWREVMQIDWTNRAELTEAVPRVYGEYIGKLLLAAVAAQAA